MPKFRIVVSVLAAVALTCALAAVPAGAQLPLPIGPPGAQVQPYGTNDYGGFRDILPPGTNGLDNLAQLLAFRATGARPAHNNDQLGPYANLVYVAPHLQAANVPQYFKDSTFGVPPGQTAHQESPEAGVTIVRDRAYGVPHVYGNTRAELMFGIGYATAEDRLFFIDVLRHAGRGELSAFAGGANTGQDASTWSASPYTEQDLQHQVDQLRGEGPTGQQVYTDGQNYVAGINAYIAAAKLNPTLMPGEYAALGHPQGPAPFQPSDLVAIGALVGGIFGQGGGSELANVGLDRAFEQRYGVRAGYQDFLDFRSVDDPEAPTTVHGTRFPYRTIPAHPLAGSVALPDARSLHYFNEETGSSASATAATASSTKGASASRSLLGLPPLNSRGAPTPPHASNALVVSGRKSASGHPLAVFGPQVAYFTPEILMEEDIHGPGVDAAGAAFPGVNLYVELGHGRDYAWSATSASQDIIDTFAVPLCNPSGGPVSESSTYYEYRGQCLPMQVLQRVNHYTPNLADSTPAGTQVLTAYRTKVGLLAARATIHGRPVAYVRDRSTYMHELDSAIGFEQFNDPGYVHDARSWQQAAYHIGYTFNWFYVDSRHVAYFNSGNNPIRTRNTNPLFPVWANFGWTGFDPNANTAHYTPFSQHPQTIDQEYLTSWNNKQAPGYSGADEGPYTSIYRSQLLDDRVRRDISGSRKMTLTQLINDMEDAGTVDLRADKVLPYVLRIMTSSGPASHPRPHRPARHHARPRHRRGHGPVAFTGSAPPLDPALRPAVAELDAWVRDGAHRRASAPGQPYAHSDAIRIMDAWWPLLVKAVYQPAMGGGLLGQLESFEPIDNVPNGGDGLGHGSGGTTPHGHEGSSWDVGFYGYVQKDLRQILGLRVAGRYHRTYCGAGNFARCRAALESSLRQAIAVPATTVYSGDSKCKAGDQVCWDSIAFRALGAVTQPLIPWVNRPTFQQADEVQRHR